MKRLWLIVVPMLLLSLVVGAIGCKSGEGQPTPTATPTQTAAVTATSTPTSTSTGISPTHLTFVTRGMPTPTPSYRGVLPRANDTITLSSLVRTTAARQNLSGYELLEAVQDLPRVISIQPDEPFDDSYDISSLMLSLSTDELSQFGIELASPIDISRIAPVFPEDAPEPYYYIRVQVVLCANDDGSGGAADWNGMTPEFFSQVINTANTIFAGAGMRLVYDPATDFERRNSTLLNLDFTVPSYINYYAPSYAPPINKSYMETLAQPHLDARQSVGREYRGKMVLLLCDGNELVYNSSASRWQMQDRGYAFSWEDLEFVALPTHQGDVLDWARLLAHESGHYFHQWHPQVEVQLTGAEDHDASLNFNERQDILSDRAAAWVKDYIDQGHSVSEGLDVLDADITQVGDTPPDPGPQFMYYMTGDACGSLGTAYLDVPLQYTTMPYTIQPDRGDVVSYFFRCWNISQHYTPDQIAGMRKALEEENRWHLIGTPMRLKTLDTHVLNNEVYYNAVWQPSTSNDVAVFGWAYDDFIAKSNEMWNSGWRTTQLNSYVLNGQVLYDAVWQPSTSNDYAVCGWTFTDFVDKCNEEDAAGMRLKLLDTYVVDNQVYYNAVWQPGTSDEPAVFGWAYDDFVTEANDRLNSGWTMKLMNSYVLNSQVYYDAVWQSGTTDDYTVLGWTYDDFLTKSNEMRGNGWRLKMLKTHVVDNQVYYDAVWQHVAPNDYAVYGWAFTDFLIKYDNLW